MNDEMSPLAQHIAKTLFGPGGRFAKPCCDFHQASGCCDPDDCGPCCERCPTCPTLSAEPTADDVPESQRHRVCFCAVVSGRMHLRGDDCAASQQQPLTTYGTEGADNAPSRLDGGTS